MTDQTNEILLRVEQLLRGILRRSASALLSQIRADKKLRRIYELTGTKDVRSIAKVTKCSLGKISRIWQSWEDEGLIVRQGKSYKKLV